MLTEEDADEAYINAVEFKKEEEPMANELVKIETNMFYLHAGILVGQLMIPELKATLEKELSKELVEQLQNSVFAVYKHLNTVKR